MKILININERAFLYVNGRPTRYLKPGRYKVNVWFKDITVVRKSVDEWVAQLRPEELALVPAEDILVVPLKAYERAIVFHRDRPVRWLGEGEHLIWTVDRRTAVDASGIPSVVHNVRVQVIDTSDWNTPPLRKSVLNLVPPTDYVEAQAPESAVALRFVDGALESVLGSGRHAAWTTEKKISFAVIDLRERILHVPSQEVMTKDRVSVRLNLSTTYKVDDPRQLTAAAQAPDDRLYLAMQFAAREAVALRTLDELLASRDTLGDVIKPRLEVEAASLGFKLIQFGVRDIILPGDMKALLNRVIEAQKEAEANVIMRREETAAVRSMANTAKVMADNPTLLRLKELEAYKELAGKVGKIQLVLNEGGIPKFLSN